MSNQEKRPFRAIVVGSGIAGLTMTNTLQRAGIDHVVLEARSSVVRAEGASIGMWPNGARILSQLGIWETVKAESVEMKRNLNRLPDGSPIVDDDLFTMVKKNHGIDFRVIERRRFIRALYTNVPDKSKIKLNSKITEVVDTDEGIRVTLADGSHEDGDVLLACDGVHSQMRKWMWKNANKASPGLITEAEKSSYKITYKCLVGVSPRKHGVGPCDMNTIHNKNLSFLIITQPEEIYFFIYVKLPYPEQYYTSTRYNEQDAEELATEIAELPISETLKFGEVWENRSRAQLLGLEEGVFDHWHHGRIALIGDAAHKMTPNAGLGGASAIEDVAAIGNILYREVRQKRGTISKNKLASMLQEYEDLRKERVTKIVGLSGWITRVHAWDTSIYKFVCNYLIPWIGEEKVAEYMAPVIRSATRLDYLPVTYLEHTIAWDDEKSSEKVIAKKEKGITDSLVSRFLFLFVIVGAFAGIYVHFNKTSTIRDPIVFLKSVA